MKIFLTKNHGNQKCLQKIPQKTAIFCQPTRESFCYIPPQYTHVVDRFHHPQILKIVHGTHS